MRKLAQIVAFVRDGLKNHVSPVRFWPSAQAKSLGNSALASATPSVVTMSPEPVFVIKKLVGILPHDCEGGAGCSLPGLEHIKA